MSARNPTLFETSQLQSTLETIRTGVTVLDKNRRRVFWNAAMQEMTGPSVGVGEELPVAYPRNRLLDMDGSIVPPERTPMNRAFAGEDVNDALHEYIESNGAHRWMRISAHRLLNDARELEYVVITAKDVTSQVKSEQKLRFMVQSAGALSLVTGLHERLGETALHAVPSLADWCAIDTVGKSGVLRVAAAHSDPSLQEHVRSMLSSTLGRGTPSPLFDAVQKMEPLFVPVVTEDMVRESARCEKEYEALKRLNISSLIVVPITSNGRGHGAMTLAYSESGRTYTQSDFEFFKEYGRHLGVIYDNARLYEEIKRRDKSKELFLASLSHELRNPLAPIKSSLDLLKLRGADAQTREELAVIEHQFDHMAKLLDDLLDVTRFTHAKIELRRAPVQVCRLVRRALVSAEPLLREGGISLETSFPREPITVHADPTRLEQAVTNLLNNAIKFTPRGGRICAKVHEAAGHALITIADTGTGIAPSDLPHIFDMYYQGMRARSEQSGLGIGLLLVKNIVALHGGTVQARSDGPGHGSEFTLRLPVAKAPQGEDAGPVKTPFPYGSPEGHRVLIVDDNTAAADSLAKLLAKLGAYAESAYSGEETLAHAQLSQFDILLLDIGMPRMDGFQLVRALREAGVRAPIVALTGYGLSEDKDRAKEAGFDAHLTKPVGLKDLLAVFDALLPSKERRYP